MKQSKVLSRGAKEEAEAIRELMAMSGQGAQDKALDRKEEKVERIEKGKGAQDKALSREEEEAEAIRELKAMGGKCAQAKPTADKDDALPSWTSKVPKGEWEKREDLLDSFWTALAKEEAEECRRARMAGGRGRSAKTKQRNSGWTDEGEYAKELDKALEEEMGWMESRLRKWETSSEQREKMPEDAHSGPKTVRARRVESGKRLPPSHDGSSGSSVKR